MSPDVPEWLGGVHWPRHGGRECRGGNARWAPPLGGAAVPPEKVGAETYHTYRRNGVPQGFRNHNQDTAQSPPFEIVRFDSWETNTLEATPEQMVSRSYPGHHTASATQLPLHLRRQRVNLTNVTTKIDIEDRSALG